MFQISLQFLGIAFFGLIMGTINKVLGEDDGASDIIDSKLEEVDLWLLKLDNTRNDKSLPRPLYEKIKEYIERSLKQDYDILIEGYDFFEQLKPTLRYNVVYEVFEEFIDHFYPALFKDLDVDYKVSKEFISYYICNLYCRVYVPGQVIAKKGDKFSEMYMIEHGGIVLSLRAKWQDEYFQLPPFTYFGDYQILLGYKSTECYCVSR